VIKFQEPNKAWLRDTINEYVAPAQAAIRPYVIPKDEFGEHWVCNGQSIFEFDYRRKTLIERSLPPELQGKGIGDGNFPLLYGRSAAAINQRYWIRPLSPPAAVENEYWLELWPRNAADAAAYKFIVVVIAQSDMRLAGLSFVARNYDAKRNPARVDYRFDNRTVALKGKRRTLAIVGIGIRQPKTPLGWRKEVQKFASPTPTPNTKELIKRP
jgi:TIGR03009 family protein